MMNRRVRHILDIVISLVLFVTVFFATWFATVFVLYEYVYGDSHGGRWTRFAWPVALVYAVVATAAYLISRWSGRRIPPRLWALGAIVLFVFAAAWILLVQLWLPPFP